MKPAAAPLLPLLLLLLLLACLGCAHAPAANDRQGPDERVVLIEFWATWCNPCLLFDLDYRRDPEVQRALRGVRLERYDIDSLAGAFKYRNLIGRDEMRVPLFVVIVDGRIMRMHAGLPRSKELFVSFVDEIAAFGGNEREVLADLAAHPEEPQSLMRAARYFAAHQRSEVAAGYWARVAGDDDAPAELRAEADWNCGRLQRKGKPRDPRALVDFALAHAGTRFGDAALHMIAVVSDVGADDAARALRANWEALSSDGNAINELAYHALAAHQYDLALELAEESVRLLKSAAAYDTLAEVYYYRQEPAMAVRFGERATALEPKNVDLAANLARFRRADGTPCTAVENFRFNGIDLLKTFYGD